MEPKKVGHFHRGSEYLDPSEFLFRNPIEIEDGPDLVDHKTAPTPDTVMIVKKFQDLFERKEKENG